MSQSRGDAPPRGAEAPSCRSRDGQGESGVTAHHSPAITRSLRQSLWGHTSRTEINLPPPANHTPPRAPTITGARQSGGVCSARQHTVRRSSIQPDKFECGTCTAIVGCLHPPPNSTEICPISRALTHTLTRAMSVSPPP